MKLAMVTGASGGIGRAFAVRLAKDGYRLTLVARSRDKLEALAKELGDGHRVLVADLSAAKDIARVAADVRESHYDLLINNAGAGTYGQFMQQPLEPHLAIMRLNTESLVTLSHAFLLGSKSGDALLNVASTVGLLAFPGATIYTATKAFITSFSQGMWWEQKDRGVYVAAILPGATKTDFHRAAGGAAERQAPEAVTQTAEQVVNETMRALARRETPIIVTGLVNRAMVFLGSRLMPRKAMIALMAKQTPLPS